MNILQHHHQQQQQQSAEAMDISPALHFPSSNKLLVVDGAAAATNIGVRSASEGDPHRAMLLFREALVAVKSAFADDKSLSREALDRASQRIVQAEQLSATSGVDSSFLATNLTPLDAATLKAAVPNPSSDSDTVFSHLFSFHAPHRRRDADGHYYCCSDVDIDSSLFSAVIIYNMAVTTHKMTCLSAAGKRRDSLRTRTNCLYDMCHQLLSNTSEQVLAHRGTNQSSTSSVEITSIGRAMFDIMCMAIVNNKAELYAETVDHQLCLVHMDQLLELATTLRDQTYGDDALNTVVQTAVQFFLSNAHQSKLGTFCAAPAA
jgi:hypothetical protein